MDSSGTVYVLLKRENGAWRDIDVSKAGAASMLTGVMRRDMVWTPGVGGAGDCR